MKVLREAKRVFGMEINSDRKSDKVCLNQKGYLQKIPWKFNTWSDTRSVSIPLISHFKLAASVSEVSRRAQVHISYVVCQCSG